MNCKHHFELTTSGKRAYCTRCGEPALDPWVDGIGEPGPVRFPTREEMLADSRVARWHPIETIPDDRTVLIGCYRRVAVQGMGLEGGPLLVDEWYMRRCQPALEMQLIIFQKQATHWSEDTVGAPKLVGP